jgi:hypothetical protein
MDRNAHTQTQTNGREESTMIVFSSSQSIVQCILSCTIYRFFGYGIVFLYLCSYISVRKC